VAHATEGATTSVSVLVAVLLLAPAGLFMGMGFPLGLKLAAGRSPEMTPWLWGINGAFSVCATILAETVALASAISAAYWIGWAAFVGALLAFWHAGRVRRVA
jgi:hypothetical protein